MIGSENKPFNDIIPNFLKPKQLRNSRIDLGINCQNLLECASGIDRNRFEVVVQTFWYICHINPECTLVGEDSDIEYHELVVRDIVDSFLDLFEFPVGVWEISTEILPVYGEFQHLRVELFESCVDVGDFVVECFDEIFGI